MERSGYGSVGYDAVVSDTHSVMAGESAYENPLHDPVIRKLALVVVLGTVMSILDTTIVNVGIETLSRDFKSTVATTQWVTTGYLLSLAVVIPISGWAVERLGARRVWITSIILFTAGSVLCGCAWSMETLIAFRVVQGIGGGLIMPVGQTILARAAGPKRIGRMMSILGVPTLLAPVVGPLIGGLIVSNVSWRWMFFVNAPIGVLSVILSVRVLVHDQHHDPGRFDWLGLGLLSPGLALFVYGLSQAAAGSGFANRDVVTFLAAGTILCALFVLHASRKDRPLIEVKTFKHRNFSLANWGLFIFMAAMYATMFLQPLYYQVVRGKSPLIAGLLMAPQGLGAMITLPMGGRLVDRFGSGKIVPLGMATFLIGTIPFMLLTPTSNFWFLGVTMLLRGFGMGWILMPSMAASYVDLTKEMVAKATTTLNIVFRVGGAIGTALVAVVLQREVADRIHSHGNLFASAPSAGGGGLPHPIATTVTQAFDATFVVVIVIIVMGLVTSFFFPKHRPVAQSHQPDDADLTASAVHPEV